jgi:hypothetical protein
MADPDEEDEIGDIHPPEVGSLQPGHPESGPILIKVGEDSPQNDQSQCPRGEIELLSRPADRKI